jgi:hypothetical protein
VCGFGRLIDGGDVEGQFLDHAPKVECKRFNYHAAHFDFGEKDCLLHDDGFVGFNLDGLCDRGTRSWHNPYRVLAGVEQKPLRTIAEANSNCAAVSVGEPKNLTGRHSRKLSILTRFSHGTPLAVAATRSSVSQNRNVGPVSAGGRN